MNCIIFTRKNGLNKKDVKKFDYTKLMLTNDYLYESEEGEKQTDKKSDKNKRPKKQTKI